MASNDKPPDPTMDPLFPESASAAPREEFVGNDDSSPLASVSHDTSMEVSSPRVPQQEVAQQDPDEPFLTLTAAETASISKQLKHLLPQLQGLKQITPESLPPYHPNVKTTSQRELVATRLCKIMEEIKPMIKSAPETQRGRVELRICRYIANEYWPYPVTATSHLDVHTVYHDALFWKAPREGLIQAKIAHEAWSKERRAAGRESFGEAAARLVGRLNAGKMREEQERRDHDFAKQMREEQERQDYELARQLQEAYYDDQEPGLEDQEPGYIDPETGYVDQETGYVDQETGYDDHETGYDNQETYVPHGLPLFFSSGSEHGAAGGEVDADDDAASVTAVPPDSPITTSSQSEHHEAEHRSRAGEISETEYEFEDSDEEGGIALDVSPDHQAVELQDVANRALAENADTDTDDDDDDDSVVPNMCRKSSDIAVEHTKHEEAEAKAQNSTDESTPTMQARFDATSSGVSLRMLLEESIYNHLRAASALLWEQADTTADIHESEVRRVAVPEEGGEKSLESEDEEE